MLKLVVGGIALAAFLTPALAAEYWVVFDPSTQRCSVVERKSQETAAEATEAAGTDQSDEAATNTAEGTGNTAEGAGTNNSPDNDMTNRTSADIHLEVVAPNNSQETAPNNSQETTTDNSQETTTDNSQETAADKTETTTKPQASPAQAQTATDTDNLLRLLAQAAESSKTGEKTFIGSGFPTRAEAEYRMTIMRKCGIAK